MIPKNFVDEVVARSDVVEVVGSYVALRKAGKEYQACCPFHQEKTPSFAVNRDKQFYYCFGCGATGNALTFLMEYARLDFVEAVAELAGRLGLSVPQEAQASGRVAQHRDSQRLFDVLAQVASFYAQQLQTHPAAATAREYLRNRGVDARTASEFQLGFAPPGWNTLRDHFGDSLVQHLLDAGMISRNDQGQGYDRFRNRIMFPIHNARGQIIAFGGRILDQEKNQETGPKYLNSPETALFHKGQELYGLHRLRKLRPPPQQALVVEGYMDVVGLASHSVDNAVATLGTATSAEHITRLFRQTDSVVFCFDGDKAGRTAAWRALNASLSALRDGRTIRFAFLPQGHDPDSLVREQGAAAFTAEIEQAWPLSDFLFAHLQQQADLRTLEGQAKLVELAQPLLQQVPESALRDLLLQRLAELTHLPETRLRGRFAQPNAPTPAPTPTAGARNQVGGPSLMRTAIALLTQFPALFAGDKRLQNVPALRLPGGGLLAELIEFIGQSTHIALNTGVILEHWRDSPHHPALQKLAAMQHWLEHEDRIRDEVYGALAGLQEQQRHLQLESLLQKASVAELTEQERSLLLALSRPRRQHN